jgi:hypothetical protein
MEGVERGFFGTVLGHIASPVVSRSVTAAASSDSDAFISAFFLPFRLGDTALGGADLGLGGEGDFKEPDLVVCMTLAGRISGSTSLVCWGCSVDASGYFGSEECISVFFLPLRFGCAGADLGLAGEADFLDDFLGRISGKM